MRFKTFIALAASGVGLLALSLPASSTPLPRERPARSEQRVQPDNSAPPPSYARHVIAGSKPLFGWPALVVEARKYIGTNPTDRKRLWCATFMNLILRKAGYAGTNSDAAKSFVSYGRRIAKPRIGAIAVLTRGKRGGHVGVVSGIDPDGNPIIISGNHNKRVGVAVYPRSRVIAYVMPTEQRAAPVQVADGARASSAGAGQALESPIAELLAAINAEQDRAEAHARARPVRPVRAAQPPQPQRLVQQLPDREAENRRLPLAPALAELFGVSNGARPVN